MSQLPFGSPTSSASGDADNNKQKGDLDIFLSTLESKLRGPFSSLDLAKSVTTLALKNNGLTPTQYLDQVAQVFNRPDKVVKLRILIGLLGLEPPKRSSTTGQIIDPGSNINPEIFKIVQLGQDENEEWVKTIGGLVQGIMFHDSNNSRESCRGAFAQQVLEKTSEEICQRIENQVQRDQQQEQSQQADQAEEEDDDLNASFAPYRYGLISKTLLRPIIPECTDGTNPHFTTKTGAAILKIDETLDIQRAKEERDHQQHSSSTSPKNGNGNRSTSPTPGNGGVGGAPKRDLPPGYRPTSLVRKVDKKDPPKTNMFTSSKKSRMPQKTVLRRKGATAQSLVSKTSIRSKTAAAGGAAGGNTAGGGAIRTATTSMTKPTGSGRFASRFGSGVASVAGRPGVSGGAARARLGGAGAAAKSKLGGRSRMKMIDVNEVDTLTKEHAKRDDDLNNRSSKKRRIMELARERGLQNNKKLKTTAGGSKAASASSSAASATANGDTGPAAPAATDNDTMMMTDNPSVAATSDMSAEQQPQPQQAADWQILLNERSNKLSDEDRVRVQQFFENNYNPTPDQPIYKMKIHEQRGTDPTTGQDIKETFYLELDYNTFTSKQSKKVKRY